MLLEMEDKVDTRISRYSREERKFWLEFAAGQLTDVTKNRER